MRCAAEAGPSPVGRRSLRAAARAAALRARIALLASGLLWGAVGTAPAQTPPQPLPPLRLLIDSATQLPMAHVESGRVLGGMTHDLGTLLAARLGRRLETLTVPRKRLESTLLRGEADLVCTYLPEWLPTPGLQWSQPFFPQADVLVARADAPVRTSIAALADQRVGTVLGFVYADLSRALGPRFQREDAPSAEANLRKVAAGRLQYAVVEQRLLRHLQRTGVFATPIHPELVLATQRTRCALSPRAPVRLADLDAAIARAWRDGALASLYHRYD